MYYKIININFYKDCFLFMPRNKICDTSYACIFLIHLPHLSLLYNYIVLFM